LSPTCLFGAAQVIGRHMPVADADWPFRQQPPPILFGDVPAWQHVPSLASSATAHEIFGGSFLHSPVTGSAAKPGRHIDTIFMQLPVAGSGVEPGGQGGGVPVPGGHSPVFGSGTAPCGHSLNTICVLHFPVSASTVAPTGQH